MFAHGAVAVLLREDPRVAFLWDELLARNGDEVLPWDATLEDIARNFRPGRRLGEDHGDVVYYVPGVISYIARKIVIRRSTDGSSLACSPAAFVAGAREYSVPAPVLEAAWELVSDILRALSPPGARVTAGAAVVERLRYDTNLDDVVAKSRMLSSAVNDRSVVEPDLTPYFRPLRTRWQGRFAARLFGRLTPALSRRHQRHGISPLVRRILKLDEVPAGAELIGEPHTDSGRVFTALCGSRSAVRTQVHDGRAWRDLPLDPCTLAILPGAQLGALSGVPPTLHRVLHVPSPNRGHPNVTLLVGAKLDAPA